MIKLLLTMSIVILNLFAYENFEYKIKLDSKEVAVKEAILISVELRQIDNHDVMRFDFDFDLSDKYELELLESQDSKDSKGRTFVKSEYLLYPLKSGNLKIRPHLTIKKASKEELKKFVTGSADELMYIQTRNKSIGLDEIDINVKDIDSDIELIGDYKLEYKIDHKSISSEEQVNIVYVLSGSGYKSMPDSLLYEFDNVNSFMEKEQFDKRLFHKTTYRYALGSDKDFVIPAVSIVCYNPKEKKRYVLQTSSIDIHVDNTTQKQINKNVHGYSFEWKKFLNYLLLFIFGYLLQYLLSKFTKNNLSEKEIFVKTVKRAKTSKELLKYLLSRDDSRFKKEVEELELMIYQEREFKLSSIKSSILERFSAVNEDSI